MNLKYKIELHTLWHCGSGLAAGADVDALVSKDHDNLPYVPGKTIKGLIREAVDELMAFDMETNDDIELSKDYLSTFGFFDKNKTEMQKSEAFFTNATLSDEERNAIKSHDLSRFLYTAVSQTAIDENGVAKKNSLRRTQTTVPCTLYGEIIDLPDSMCYIITRAMSFIKNLGLDRNRGLGRCTFTVVEGKEETA